jgi:ERF superfamily
MQRSSQSIASLAAALAKAQAELVNPEKSLVATIRSDGPRGAEQTFRYAPLSSGLDIVRKTLGQHEIATVQTTAIDQTAGIVNLTTVLAHSSGEWIASDWPVCAISETATPHRMGAALTYARRYALFTLVGIAGEDDLDAPNLNAPTTPASGAEKPASKNLSRLNGGQERSTQELPGSRGAKAVSGFSKLILDPEPSAALRDQLAAELRDIGSPEDAANWAHRVLRAKNGLTVADAACIEEAFRAKLAMFATDTADGPEIPQETKRPKTQSRSDRGKKQRRSAVIDKSVLALPESRRVRDREHVRYVTQQSCLICGRRPSDAHHLRFAQNRALSRKVSDEFTVPLCRGHHREVHRSGDEATWWNKAGIDPTVAARALWLETHPLLTITDKTRTEDASLVNNSDLRNARHKRRPRRRGPDDETKPFEKTAQ